MQIRDAVATVTEARRVPGGLQRSLCPCGAGVIVADVDAKGADDTVSQITAAGREGRFVHADVGSGGADPARPI